MPNVYSINVMKTGPRALGTFGDEEFTTGHGEHARTIGLKLDLVAGVGLAHHDVDILAHFGHWSFDRNCT